MIIMAESSRFERLRELREPIRDGLREQGLDGWLLYDLHARNPVSSGLLQLTELTRRWFVWLPAEGEPVALVHGIEEGPWKHWPWERRSYVGWRELDDALRSTLSGAERVAMEYSPRDAVPSLDLVPAGVVALVEAAGPDVVSSGELISRYYSRWTEQGLASHRRAARVVAETAREAFERVAEHVRGDQEPREGELRRWILDRLAENGCGVGADSIVAIGPNAADPHYAPGEEGAIIERGDALLIDLWGKESEDAVYADQTWMGYLGDSVPEHVRKPWNAIREARDAAVELLRERHSAGETTPGYEVDDVVRGVVSGHGYGDAFIHRTGHSIDTELHGTGPNIDNLETHELRALIPGIGFSIEPGVYLPGEVGLRTEIDVYMADDGPEVTTPRPQSEVFALLGAGSR